MSTSSIPPGSSTSASSSTSRRRSTYPAAGTAGCRWCSWMHQRCCACWRLPGTQRPGAMGPGPPRTRRAAPFPEEAGRHGRTRGGTGPAGRGRDDRGTTTRRGEGATRRRTTRRRRRRGHQWHGPAPPLQTGAPGVIQKGRRGQGENARGARGAGGRPGRAAFSCAAWTSLRKGNAPMKWSGMERA
jgi:hypothetical protein